jgi:sterol desaturase/sphingolipid hydroxylase (fatty acid hydroxylase superfamily)
MTVGTAYLVILAFLIFERLRPAERGQTFANIWWNVRSGLLTTAGSFVLGPLSVVIPLMIHQRVGNGWIDLGLGDPQTIGGQALAVIVYLLLLDFFQYWWHRMQHTFWPLWASHRLHHSDEALNASTNLRGHWIETLYARLFMAVPIAVLFTPFGVSGTFAYLSIMGFGYLNHANLRISLGPFVTSPQYHRIHHSRLPEHQNKNIASMFPLFDILFGTYYRPKPNEYPPTGLYEDRDAGVLAAHAMVFRLWCRGVARMMSRSRSLARGLRLSSPLSSTPLPGRDRRDAP